MRTAANTGDLRANVAALSHVVRAFAAARTPQPARLWCPQMRKAEKCDFSQSFPAAMQADVLANWPKCTPDMIERMVWLLDPARVDDMDTLVLQSLGVILRGQASQTDRDMVALLPDDKCKMVQELMTRAPIYDGKIGRIGDPDQLALLYHSHRVGAAQAFTRNLFTPPMSQAAISSVVHALLSSHRARRGQPCAQMEKASGSVRPPKPRGCPFPE